MRLFFIGDVSKLIHYLDFKTIFYTRVLKQILIDKKAIVSNLIMLLLAQ